MNAKRGKKKLRDWVMHRVRLILLSSNSCWSGCMRLKLPLVDFPWIVCRHVCEKQCDSDVSYLPPSQVTIVTLTMTYPCGIRSHGEENIRIIGVCSLDGCIQMTRFHDYGFWCHVEQIKELCMEGRTMNMLTTSNCVTGCT